MLYALYAELSAVFAVVTLILGHFVRTMTLGDKAQPIFQRFLMWSAVYLVTDALWSLFESEFMNATTGAYNVIGAACFISSGIAAMMWARYILVYVRGRTGGAYDVLCSSILAAIVICAIGPLFLTNRGILFLRILLFLLIFSYYIIADVVLLASKAADEFHQVRRNLAILFTFMPVVGGLFQFLVKGNPFYPAGVMLLCLCSTCFIVTREESHSYAREADDFRHDAETAMELSRKDGLTGAKNRMAFEEASNAMTEQIASGGAEFAVAMMDVNNLKEINDTYGHELGDQILILAARALETAFLSSEIYRIGGDEYASIIVGSDYTFLDDAAARVEAAVKRYNIGSDLSCDLSIAVGIVRYDPSRDDTCSDVMRRADVAMYERKREMKAAIR